jgi:hypothetical protein
MDQQGVAGFQVEEEEFGAPAGLCKAIAGEGFEALAGQGLAQALGAGGDPDDLASHEVALHGLAHGFYFG